MTALPRCVPPEEMRDFKWHGLHNHKKYTPMEWNGGQWVKDGRVYTPERLAEIGYSYFCTLMGWGLVENKLPTSD